MVVVVIVAILAVIALPTYLDYVKSSYASEARTVMSNINNASKMYYQTRGDWPSEIDELERAGQLDVSRSTKLKWLFVPRCTLKRVRTLVVCSTSFNCLGNEGWFLMNARGLS